MREDMFEVIIERPRWGSRMRYSRRSNRGDGKFVTKMDPDLLQFQIGLKRAAAHAKDRKRLSENLNPLRRYLHSQVNRPWNKVWSDICENLKTSSTVQQHVRDHVKDFVATQVTSRDGVRWVRSRWGKDVPLFDSYFELYVDPRTGILRRNKTRKTPRQILREERATEARERAARMRELGRYLQVHKFDDGTWWLVTLEPTPWERPLGAHNKPASWGYRDLSYTDVVIGTSLTKLPPEELYNRRTVYAIAKRQLSRREVTRLGLPR